MMAEIMVGLALANVWAAAATLLVLAARGPLRRRFGARTAYLLWTAPLGAAFASLIPARTIQAGPGAHLEALPQFGPHLPPEWLPALWLIGAGVALAAMAWGQIAFLRRAARGEAGPAIVGVVAPRLVIPADYQARFTADERRLIRTHERVHIERGDPRVNAFAAALQCLNWFNPLVHVAAHYMRLDQELACDAVVAARLPGERRRYAEALLKTQLSQATPPLGCSWPARGRHPLEVRLAALALPAPTYDQLRLGSTIVTLAAIAAGLAVWAAKPPKLEAPAPTAYRLTAPIMLLLDIQPPDRVAAPRHR